MSGTERTGKSVRGGVRRQRTRVLTGDVQPQGRPAIPATAAEWERIAALTRDVGVALVQRSALQASLQQCAQALVTHLGAAFARIWTLNAATNTLEMQASAGLYTHLDGAHSRVPVGALKIGLIASERRPHLTNHVIGDPRVNDQEWARHEGMVAFAGYPLLVEGEPVGVMALFARQPLSPVILDAMASVANTIALGIERKRIEDERAELFASVERARREAEVALSTRNDFLSSITHDLKTPLTSMSANIQLLQRRLLEDTPESRAKSADRLRALAGATVKMTGMVDDLFDITKVQAGQSLDLQMRPLTIVALVERVIADAQATSERHRIILQAPAQPIAHTIIVQGDAARLDRALSNLLSNAIKYSPAGGAIQVIVTVETLDRQERVVIHVRDSGVGIPAADLPHIFTPFYRATNVVGRIKGTGIGLANVAQVVAQHGGSIVAHSEEGYGSDFVISLPCQLGEAASDPSGSHETPNDAGA